MRIDTAYMRVKWDNTVTNQLYDRKCEKSGYHTVFRQMHGEDYVKLTSLPLRIIYHFSQPAIPTWASFIRLTCMLYVRYITNRPVAYL